MLYKLKHFLRNEEGAVTVDWVVLTAAVVGLAVVAVLTIRDETNGLSGRTAGYLERQDPTTYDNIQDINSLRINGGAEGDSTQDVQG